VIHRTRREVDDTGERGAQDRWRQARRVAVERKKQDRRGGRGARRQPRGAAAKDEQRGEQRDVAAGDRDDVVRSGFLEVVRPPLPEGRFPAR